MRLIDAERFENALNETEYDVETVYGDGYSHKLVCDVLETMPTVDAVQVVRCRDCIHRDPEDKKCDCGCWHMPFTVGDDDFCSHGQTAKESEAEYDELRYSWARDEYESPIY